MVPLREGLLNKKNIEKINKSDTRVSFNKKDLKYGTVVMFRDKTFGVYYPKDKVETLVKFFKSSEIEKGAFLCHSSPSSKSKCYFNINAFDDNLKYHGISSYEYDVERVYCNLLDYYIINEKDFVYDFPDILFGWIIDKKYIERK